MFELQVRSIINDSTSPELTFNEKKRGLYTKGQRRMVTGLILTPDGRISIGRERKREISSLLHKATLNQLDVERKGFLKGMLGFCLASEPSFVNSMRKKYGDPIVDSILHFHVPKRGVPPKQPELD